LQFELLLERYAEFLGATLDRAWHVREPRRQHQQQAQHLRVREAAMH
jgi:hypothetical protein